MRLPKQQYKNRPARVASQIQQAAARIREQAELDELLAGAPPMVRDAMLERIRPFLRFRPAS